MENLTTKEEEIMRVLWSKGKALVKEVREELPEPKPHVNTVATVMRRLVDKGYIGFEDFGNVHLFFPSISQDAYNREQITPRLVQQFGNSYKNIVSFFAREEKISAKDLKEILEMIEKQNPQKP
jgi:predicted transcriptional regulator